MPAYDLGCAVVFHVSCASVGRAARPVLAVCYLMQVRHRNIVVARHTKGQHMQQLLTNPCRSSLLRGSALL